MTDRDTLEIVYQDESLVAINKQSGLLVHRSHIDRHETRFALQLLRDQIGQRVFPVHRLDKPTSGVLIFALSSEVARAIGAAFRANGVTKRYLAVVRGWPEDQGVIDYPLVDGPERGSVKKDSAPKSAVTSFRTLNRTEIPYSVGRYPVSRYALVEIAPQSGRRHQIRRHFKHIFHPLIGDTRYGEGRHNRLFRAQFSSSRLLLHSFETRINHPVSGDRICIKADIPEDFLQTLERAGLQNGTINPGGFMRVPGRLF